MYLRALAAAVEASGNSKADFLKRLNIDPVVLEDCDRRVPKAQIAAAWDLTATVLGDRYLGLHAAEFAPPETFEVLDHLAANQPTLADAARTVVQYYRLCDDKLPMHMDFAQDECTVSCLFKTESENYSRHWADLFFAILIVRARRLADVPGLAPLRVSFQHSPPEDVAEYARVFGVTPTFSASITEMVIARRDLGLPITGASRFLSGVVLAHAERRLSLLPGSGAFLDTAKRTIVTLLAQGVPRLDEAASMLHCSARTLQARLKNEGTTFQGILEETRRELAVNLLRDPRIRLMELPLILQYSESSAFHRAFVRWMGTTPGEYRERAAFQMRAPVAPTAGDAEHRH